VLTPWIRYLPGFIRIHIEGRQSLQKVIDNVAWLFVDNIVRMAVSLFVGIWIARYLGPVQFGQYSYAIAFISIFSMVGALAADANVVRDVVKEPLATDEILGTATFLKFLGGLMGAVLCTSTIIVLRSDDAVVRWLVIILAAGITFQAMETIALWFQAQVQSKYTVWAKNIAVLVMASIKVALVLLNAPIVAFAWAGLAEALLSTLALIIVYHMSGQRISTWLLNLHRAKVLLRDSWPLLISALTAVLYLRMDVIMLGEMHSEAAVGIYGAATRISEAWYFIPTALVASLQPSIMQAKAHSEELFQARLRNVYNLMSALSISVAMVVTLFADKLVWLLFGQSYEAAGTVLVVHVWAAVAVSLGVASSQYLVVENLQKISMYRTTVGLLCNLGLNVFLIPRYGAWGAAVATLISYSVSTLSMGIFMQGRQQTVMMLRSLNPLEWRSLSFR
jgi:O-antigen/teichoic acid export membrane protein